MAAVARRVACLCLLAGLVSGCDQQDQAAEQLKTGLQALEQSNYQAAKTILTRLAVEGNAEAQYRLGEMALRGQGTSRDYKAAARWFRMAAEQGHPAAQYRLASLYAYGQGVEKNYALAAEWAHKARENGYGSGDQGKVGPGETGNTTAVTGGSKSKEAQEQGAAKSEHRAVTEKQEKPAETPQ